VAIQVVKTEIAVATIPTGFPESSMAQFFDWSKGRPLDSAEDGRSFAEWPTQFTTAAFAARRFRNIELVVADAYSSPFAPASFDVVI